ncbi:hypothetical protein DYQ86_09190 [Acidobacteria bacterium AB60]|nr:hypothetical protein DYQ86_09190 [Acidobacteria bacterium AB60]
MKVAGVALAASILLAMGVAGCKSGINGDTTTRETAQLQAPAQDPASANLAPVSNASDNTGAPPGSYRTSHPQSRANEPGSHATNRYSADEQYQDPYASPYSSGNNYDDYSDYEVPVAYAPDAPPPLPDYQQPAVSGDNYIWTPGYWNYESRQGFYWVPGAWVVAPYAGALWTPGWWGYDEGRYAWHRGFWGPHVGYYGGIAYGHGYDGHGYEGGYWRDGQFYYNKEVNNVSSGSAHNVYAYRVSSSEHERTSYNGGRGGVEAKPRPREIAAYHEQHTPPMTAQMQMAQQARGDQQNFAQPNHGHPGTPAEAHPLQADSGVRPPAILNEQAIRQPETQMAANGQSEPSSFEFRNNVHPISNGSHWAQENPGQQGTTQPGAPRDDHQAAPGRPMMLHPTQAPQPERPGPNRPQNTPRDQQR